MGERRVRDRRRAFEQDGGPDGFDSARGYIDFVDRSPLFAASYVGAIDPGPPAKFLDYSTGPFFSRPHTLAYVIDLTQVKDFGSLQRKAQADWNARNRELIERHTAGVCFALSSRIQRGMLTAVFWLAAPGYPHHVVSTRDEAIRWSVEQVRAAGIAVPQQSIEDTQVAPY